ncbi:MAG TPA: transposase [Thermoanaerobaculia bacterium]|nr:transposase [Thermoanaerobaculia bacterium]
MKQQAIQYLALDVHQATSVASVRDESGAIRMRATVPTEGKAIVGLVKGVGPRVHVVFEEGTHAQWLYGLLVAHAERVVVCNVRGRSETTNKSDRIDADGLSEQLRLNALKSVYHGSPGVATLKELVRCYMNLVDDSTRVMQRVKAIYRGRAIATKGEAVYRPSQRKLWLAKLEGRGAQVRAGSLLTQLDALLELRRKARAAMIAEARRQTGWKILRSVPFLGPIRVSLLLAIVATPFRFRGRRQFWPYVGLAVVTRASAENEIVDGKLRRRKRAPLTRGLNRNHNPALKNVFKGAANAAAAKAGPLKDFFDRCVAGGVSEEMAKLTLARKLASVALRLWKKGELWDPKKLTIQAT